MKKRFLLILMAGIFCLPIVSGVVFAKVVVVVNPDNPATTISKKELSKIFKQKQKVWAHKEMIKVVHLGKDHPLRREFSQKVLNMSSESLEKYYFKRALSGKGQPPRIASSPDDVISFVSGSKNAIGYLDLNDVDSSVKILKVDGKEYID